MTLEEAQRDPRAFLAGFAGTEHSVHFDPELARRQRFATQPGEVATDPLEAHAERAFHLLGGAEAIVGNLLHDPTDTVARAELQWETRTDA